ncbi:Hypothetical predicted protein [Mytilus galloprovincialis]|uniref:Uncharacterized protein n=1 Tax=Mytilus galloprovincialis TaxID=29158 RepID=A0A8B6F0R7_MYTGA|nr:Hypothetical predicted protein [Mytilus galloprovincialis]
MGAIGILTLVLCAIFPLVASISKVDETVIDTLKQVREQLTSIENKLKKKTCEPGWLKYKGSCYFFSKNSKTWINAEVNT